MLTQATSLLRTAAIAAGAVLLLGGPTLRAELSTQERNERLATISEDARELQYSASRMELALRVKDPDLAAVRVMLGEIDAHIDALETDVLALQSASPAWASGSESFQLMKQKTDLLKAFAEGKASLLEAPNAKKNRKVLAAKAKGIALRADLLSGYAAVDAD